MEFLTRHKQGTDFVEHLGIYLDEEDHPDALDYFLQLHKQATTNGMA